MVKLKAPAGCSSYTVNGVSQDVPEDGIVDVPVNEAIDLQSHGFVSPTLAEARDDVMLSRGELHEMLGHLGFAVADSAIPAVKMVEMLKAAVKTKAEAIEKAQKDLAEGADKAADDVAGKKKRGNS